MINNYYPETLFNILKHDIYDEEYDHKMKVWSEDFNDYCDYNINSDNIVITNDDECIVLNKDGKDNNDMLRIHPSKELKYHWDLIGTKYTIIRKEDTIKKNRTKLKIIGMHDPHIQDLHLELLNEHDFVTIYYDRQYCFYMMNYLNYEYEQNMLKMLRERSIEININ